MDAEEYIINALKIELFSLQAETSDFDKKASIKKAVLIKSLKRAILFHKKLKDESKLWINSNPFNSTDTFWNREKENSEDFYERVARNIRSYRSVP